MIKGLGITALMGTAIGTGVTSLATKHSEDGDGAMGVAKGLGIAAGVTGAIGIAGMLAASKGGQGVADELMNLVFIGAPSLVLTGAAAGIGGAALGTALIAHAKG